jgi:3-deoxy-D-manno-octulosonate 8-phosphate phosphatase (KDO 8-P phosphatase)
MSTFTQNVQYLLNYYSQNKEEFARELGKNSYWVDSLVKAEVEPEIETLIKISNLFTISVDKLIKENIQPAYDCLRNKSIRFLIMDVDGVLTDGGMYYTESGDEYKKFFAKDGMAIVELQSKGIKVGFISAGFRQNTILNRAKTLKIDYVYVGRENKKEIMLKWCDEMEINPGEVAYIGDDLNDLDVIDIVGFSACPSDAVNEVKEKVDIILKKEGGNGCVREFIDIFLLYKK